MAVRTNPIRSALVAFVTLCMAASTAGAHDSLPAPLVRSDGTIDLELARSSGYQGPIDLKDRTVEIDKASGLPRVSSARSPEDINDTYWSKKFFRPGVFLSPGDFPEGIVHCMTIYKGDLIIGGRFDQVDSVAVKNIARWDGSSWHSLGGGLYAGGCCTCFSDGVYSLAVFQNNLIAGGCFDTAGVASAKYIAQWNGIEWGQLGDGLNSSVLSLQEFDGQLYIGGSFTGFVRSWSGGTLVSDTSWHVPLPVSSMTVFQNSLVLALATPANDGGICNLQGQYLAPSPHYAIWNVTVFHDSLIAAGLFNVEGEIQSIARLAGNTWEKVGDGIGGSLSLGGSVNYLCSFGGELYALGRQMSTPGGICSEAAVMKNNIWSSLGAGLTEPGGGGTQAYSGLDYDGNLIVGGWFMNAGPVGNPYKYWNGGLQSWDGARWGTIWGSGAGVYPWVRSLRNSSQGLLVAGDLHYAGRHSGGYTGAGLYFAKYDGSDFSTFDSLPPVDGQGVNAVCEYQGLIYLGGSNLSFWNGTRWVDIPGTFGTVQEDIHDLCVYQGKLIIGCEGFTYSWDGSSLSQMGTLMRVDALHVQNDTLFAASEFVPVSFWNGSAWQTLGSLGGYVRDFVTHNGRLVAGGDFNTANGGAADYIAQWDGISWQQFALPVNGPVYALLSDCGNLYAGGTFSSVGPTPASRVAYWNGLEWNSMGSGVSADTSQPANTIVYTLASYKNFVYVGGLIRFAGGRSDYGLARWEKPDACDFVPGDANGNGTVSISDVVFLINYIFAGGAAPNPVSAGDANCSGSVSISDAVYLIHYIFASGPAPCSH